MVNPSDETVKTMIEKRPLIGPKAVYVFDIPSFRYNKFNEAENQSLWKREL
jgi:hypothetical protein